MKNGQLPPVESIDEHGIEAVRRQYLGVRDGTHCYSLELEPNLAAPKGMDFRDLRMLFGTLTAGCHAVAGRAVQIVDHQLRRQLGERNRLVAERMFSIANLDTVEEILATTIDAPTANPHRG